ncbi:hypothetical protein ASF36_23440 [Methylobacterium sp. Leaf90]|nr:hypothetical protein ASF36_23440 [Methylobacterium sp. Leaf90]
MLPGPWSHPGIIERWRAKEAALDELARKHAVRRYRQPRGPAKVVPGLQRAQDDTLVRVTQANCHWYYIRPAFPEEAAAFEAAAAQEAPAA